MALSDAVAMAEALKQIHQTMDAVLDPIVRIHQAIAARSWTQGAIAHRRLKAVSRAAMRNESTVLARNHALTLLSEALLFPQNRRFP